MRIVSPAPLEFTFFFAAAVVAVAVLVSWSWRRDLLFPPFIVACQWAAVLGLYSLFHDRFVSVAPEVWLLVSTGLAAFVIGGATMTHLFRQDNVVRAIPARFRREWSLTRIAIIGSILGVPLFAMAAYELAQGGPTASLAVNLRIAYVDANIAGPGLYVYLMPISFVATTAVIASNEPKGSRTLWLLMGCLASLCYALLSSGRGPILFFIFMLLGTALIRRALSPIKVGVILAIVVFLLWILAAIALGKGVSEDSTQVGEIAGGLIDNFLVYLLGSLPALSIMVEQHPPLELGAHTFRTFLAIAQALGIEVNPSGLVREFVEVPARTNVFTVYEPYYRDFSVYGVVMSQFLFGAAHVFSYEKSVRGSIPWQIIYAALLYPACTQFFQDSYASLMSLWVQIGLITVLLAGPRLFVPQSGARRSNTLEGIGRHRPTGIDGS